MAAHYGADTAAPIIKRGLRQLYLSGSRAKNKPTVGQPRVVACVTGGGGQLFADLLREPGASSCLLEGLVPYHKESCLSFLGRHDRRHYVDGLHATVPGFCSPEMAVTLADSARDRALELTPLLAQWPDCHGVSLTATIMSHYTRRGEYRVYAAASSSLGETSSYAHIFVKGARDRAGEDIACSLLALRALFDSASTNVDKDVRNAMETFGIRQEEAAGGPDIEPVNAIGERAQGVEDIPVRVRHNAETDSSDPNKKICVLVPDLAAKGSTDGMIKVVAPARVLPQGAIIVIRDPACQKSAEDTFAVASEALSALGRRGDIGNYGSWAKPASPVLFHTSKCIDDAMSLFAPMAQQVPASIESARRQQSLLTNWGILMCGQKLKNCEDKSSADLSLSKAVELYPLATFAVDAHLLAAELENLPTLMAKGASIVVIPADDGKQEEIVRHAVDALPNSEDYEVTWLSDVRTRWYSGAVYLEDGSPSTVGVPGVYKGGWDWESGCPHTIDGGANGVMQWENGITYVGGWKHGKYHGRGHKRYSKGGGYFGGWVDGKRQGWGTTYYEGKWGYDRWEGPFVDDVPHGKGTMYEVGDPFVAEFDMFDTNGDGILSQEEFVGRLCGEFGAERESAQEIFQRLDDDGNGTVELSEFTTHQSEIEKLVGKRFERRPDQRPVFEFDRGSPVDARKR